MVVSTKNRMVYLFTGPQGSTTILNYFSKDIQAITGSGEIWEWDIRQKMWRLLSGSGMYGRGQCNGLYDYSVFCFTMGKYNYGSKMMIDEKISRIYVYDSSDTRSAFWSFDVASRAWRNLNDWGTSATAPEPYTPTAESWYMSSTYFSLAVDPNSGNIYFFSASSKLKIH